MLGASGGRPSLGAMNPEMLRLLLRQVQALAAPASGGGAYPMIISGNQPSMFPQQVVTQQPTSQSAGVGLGGLGAGFSAFESGGQAVSNVALALSNLISSAMPQPQEGASSAGSNAAMTVAGLIYTAATSSAARKSGQFCHEECGDKCAGNCGCPGCGCANGECGCGRFGSCFCSWWGLICGVDKNNDLKEALEKLERDHGRAVLLLALSNLNVDVVKVLSGQGSIELPRIDEIEEACKNVSLNFVSILQNENECAWIEAFKNSEEVLASSFWRECLVRALVDSSLEVEESVLTDCVLVTSPLSENMLACSPFELLRVAEALPRIKVRSCQETSPKKLGVMQVAAITQVVAKILVNATGGGLRPIWLSKEQLMSLIAMVIVQSGYSFASCEDGSLPIHQEMKNLTEEVCQKKLQKAQSSVEVDPQKGKVVREKFVDIADQCCKLAQRRNTILDDPNNKEQRDDLIMQMSQSRLSAVGIRPAGSRPGTPAPSLLTTPRVSPPSTPVDNQQSSEDAKLKMSSPLSPRQSSPESSLPPSNAGTSSSATTGTPSLALRRLQWTSSGHHNQSFDETEEEECSA